MPANFGIFTVHKINFYKPQFDGQCLHFYGKQEIILMSHKMTGYFSAYLQRARKLNLTKN